MNLDINELSRETGVSVRTIRYYVAQKLLPPPSGRGSAATYGKGHRDRLRLIRRLQDAALPLAKISEQLRMLDDAGIAAALAEPAVSSGKAPGTAYEYVRQVLGDPDRVPLAARRLHGAEPGPRAAFMQPAAARSTWERIVLRPDLELHVRRPLTRADQRRLDALLAEAQRLFTDSS
jgi:DNA-binding transcriptional MerR regulator